MRHDVVPIHLANQGRFRRCLRHRIQPNQAAVTKAGRLMQGSIIFSLPQSSWIERWTTASGRFVVRTTSQKTCCGMTVRSGDNDGSDDDDYDDSDDDDDDDEDDGNGDYDVVAADNEVLAMVMRMMMRMMMMMMMMMVVVVVVVVMMVMMMMMMMMIMMMMVVVVMMIMVMMMMMMMMMMAVMMVVVMMVMGMIVMAVMTVNDDDAVGNGDEDDRLSLHVTTFFCSRCVPRSPKTWSDSFAALAQANSSLLPAHQPTNPCTPLPTPLRRLSTGAISLPACTMAWRHTGALPASPSPGHVGRCPGLTSRTSPARPPSRRSRVLWRKLVKRSLQVRRPPLLK